MMYPNTNTALKLENLSAQEDAKTTKEKSAKSPKPRKKAAKPVEKTKKNYTNFSPSICKPNPGYCETIIANATKSFGGVLYASIPIELLDLDRSYQRSLGPHVQDIADHWDEHQAGALLVSYRDGRFYVVDGQNRFEAAKLLGLTHLHCMIRVGWTQKDEAIAFAGQKKRMNYLRSTAKLRAEIVGEDPVAISVKRICDKYGVECTTDGHRIGALAAADKAKRIVSVYGEDMLDDIFCMIHKLGWHNERGGFSTVNMHSLRNILLMSQDRTETMRRMVSAIKGKTFHEFSIVAKANYPTIHNGTDALTKQWSSML